MRRLIPLGLFILLVILLGVGLTRDPHRVPSPLIGKPMPAFELPALDDPSRKLSLADLKGRVTLVNVFASWCVACREEHPLLVNLAASGKVAIIGIDYKDERPTAQQYLSASVIPMKRSSMIARASWAWTWVSMASPRPMSSIAR